jgi:YHS domain-containing protein
MFRAIIEFLALLAFFAVARAVISAALRLFNTQAGGFGPQEPGPRAMPREQADGTLQSAGELRKDPVCGTFVPVATSLKRMVDGEAVYFCSADCRDRYCVTAK